MSTKYFKAIELSKAALATEDRFEKDKQICESIQLFKELCRDQHTSVEQKYQYMLTFMKYYPPEGLDILCSYRDGLGFTHGNFRKTIEDVLVKYCQGDTCQGAFEGACIDTNASIISPFERLNTAVTLFNNGSYHICHSCFESICTDETMPYEYRVDACRFLYATEQEDYCGLAQEILVEIIDNTSIPSDKRYRIIAGFIKNGLSTTLNIQKLQIPYNENFVYLLQNTFFNNDQNGVRERILSGQHLLQMKCVTDDDKKEIENVFFTIAEDSERYDMNTHADAADVILRCGTTNDVRKRARDVIRRLGVSSTGDKFIGTLEQRAQSIYDDGQNIHDEHINACIERFIIKICEDLTGEIPDYPQVNNEVSELIRSSVTEPEKKYNAFKALNRIAIDTAVFTRLKTSIAEVLIHVYRRIKNWVNETNISGRFKELKCENPEVTYQDAEQQVKNEKETMEKRLVEELVEMDETCSSGHAYRLVNVFSEFDLEIMISWDDQIKANISGRMDKRLRELDQDTRDDLTEGALLNAPEEVRKKYKDYMTSAITEIRKELFTEFVTARYITKDIFEKAFEKGAKIWLE